MLVLVVPLELFPRAIIDTAIIGDNFIRGAIPPLRPTWIADVVKDNSPGKLLTVYIPMSYMVGGFTLFLPADKVIPVDWSFEEAMRFAITAGVSQEPAKTPQSKNWTEDSR